MSEPNEGAGFPDLGGLLAQAERMQQQLMSAQAEAAATVVQGQASGGAVKIEATGALEFQSVTIDPTVIDPDDHTLLEDLVLAALHDLTAQINQLQVGAVGDLGIPDIGALGGLLNPGD